MNPIVTRKSFSKLIITVLVISQFSFVATFLFTPKKAEACMVLGNGVGCTVLDVPRIVEAVVTGIVTKIAVNYANKYLTKFIQQASDKFRIKDFLYYDQYLSDYYLSSLILKSTDDPNLQQALGIMNSLYVTGQHGYSGYCSSVGDTTYTHWSGTWNQDSCVQGGGKWNGAPDPRSALIPKLKQAMAKVYEDQGGIDPSKIYSPDASVSDREYFASAQAYFSNPPSFTEQNLRGQFGAFQSAATTASQLEVTVGNGLKAGRVIGGFCSNQDDNVDWGSTNNGKGWDPVSCAAGGGKWNASLIDQARSLITNPTAFVESNMQQAMGSIFKNNFDASDPYLQIGQALGNFLFDKLDLNNSSGTLDDGGNYDPNSYSNIDQTTLDKQVDLDVPPDGIPDGQDNNKDHKLTNVLDTCYFGGQADKAPGCQKSTDPKSAGSNYFSGFCSGVDDAIAQLNVFYQFQVDHKYQIQGESYDGGLKDQTDFGTNVDAYLWADQATIAQGAIARLMRGIKDLKSTSKGVDDIIVQLNRYYYYLNLVTERLYSSQDTDHIGDFTDGFRTLLDYTKEIYDYAIRIKTTIVNCTLPPPNDISVTPPRDFSTQNTVCLPGTPIVQTQTDLDIQAFIMPLLNSGSDPSQVTDQVNAQHPGAGLYYPPSSGTEAIGFVDFYVAPLGDGSGNWFIQIRPDCTGSTGGTGGGTGGGGTGSGSIALTCRALSEAAFHTGTCNINLGQDVLVQGNWDGSAFDECWFWPTNYPAGSAPDPRTNYGWRSTTFPGSNTWSSANGDKAFPPTTNTTYELQCTQGTAFVAVNVSP